MNAPARVITTMVPPRVDAPHGADVLGRLAAALVLGARALVAPVPRAVAAPPPYRHEPARRT